MQPGRLCYPVLACHSPPPSEPRPSPQRADYGYLSQPRDGRLVRKYRGQSGHLVYPLSSRPFTPQPHHPHPFSPQTAVSLAAPPIFQPTSPLPGVAGGPLSAVCTLPSQLSMRREADSEAPACSLPRKLNITYGYPADFCPHAPGAMSPYTWRDT